MRSRRLMAAATVGLSAVPVAAAPDVVLPESAHAGPVHDALERAVVRRVNAERSRRAIKPLDQSPKLARSASRHSLRQLRSDRLWHRRMRTAFAARRAGETLAFVPRGTRDRARWIVRTWMRSPSHRAVLLSTGVSRVGVGRRYGALGTRRGIVVTMNVVSGES